jgi:hypothetical protein
LQAQMVIKSMSEMIETSPAALSPIESTTKTTTITTTVQPDEENNLTTTTTTTTISESCDNSRDEENNVTVSAILCRAPTNPVSRKVKDKTTS